MTVCCCVPTFLARVQVCDVIDRVLASPLVAQLKELNPVSLVCFTTSPVEAFGVLSCRPSKPPKDLSSKTLVLNCFSSLLCCLI